MGETLLLGWRSSFRAAAGRQAGGGGNSPSVLGGDSASTQGSGDHTRLRDRPSFLRFTEAGTKTAIKLMRPGVTRSEIFQEQSNLPLGKERRGPALKASALADLLRF